MWNVWMWMRDGGGASGHKPPTLTAQTAFLGSECVLFSAGASASPLKILCTPEGIRLQCFMKYFMEEMKVNWYHK